MELTTRRTKNRKCFKCWPWESNWWLGKVEQGIVAFHYAPFYFIFYHMYAHDKNKENKKPA